jgi:hypothetical protein
MKHGLVLAINPVLFTNVLGESPGCKLFFLISQPRGCPWKIRDNKDRNDGDEYL